MGGHEEVVSRDALEDSTSAISREDHDRPDHGLLGLQVLGHASHGGGSLLSAAIRPTTRASVVSSATVAGRSCAARLVSTKRWTSRSISDISISDISSPSPPQPR